ncbi:hypothetical protein DMUE_2861 [Dictyocoela muelleri]|nr:hypothetical protein DMUE_2861 [Dictyocoela muelleri]
MTKEKIQTNCKLGNNCIPKKNVLQLFRENTEKLKEKLSLLEMKMCDSVVRECDDLISENMKIACFRKENVESIHDFMSFYEKYKFLTHSIQRNRDILQISADIETVGIINNYISHFTDEQGCLADNICLNMDYGDSNARDADVELDKAFRRKKMKNKIVKFLCGVLLVVVFLITIKNFILQRIFI